MAALGLVNGVPADSITVDAGAGQTVSGAYLISTDSIVLAGEAATTVSALKLDVPVGVTQQFSIDSSIGSLFISGFGSATAGNCIDIAETVEANARAQLTQFEFTPGVVSKVEMTISRISSQSVKIAFRGV